MSTPLRNSWKEEKGGKAAAFFMQNPVHSWIVTLVLLFAGINSFFNLGQLEDPDFTIKNAIIVTAYPGATAQQVEEEVTHVLESALQNIKKIDYIASWSSNGLSYIEFNLPREVQKGEVQQLWDDLRRKVGEAERYLPPGTSKPMINDDFGDVYGMLMQVYANGYSIDRVSDYVDLVKRELLLVPGVGKVALKGEQQEQIFIEVDREKISNQGLSYKNLINTIAAQNTVSIAGDVHVGDQLIRFNPTGEFQNLDDLRNIVISPPGSDTLIYASDIANIYKGLVDKPTNMVTVNGKDAISLGVSFAPGVNVVDVGKAVRKRMDELEEMRPHGIEYEFVYDQPDRVEKSVNGFLKSLVEACVIIFFTLLFTMGRKAGLLISFILIVTITGTFIFMEMYGINLQRISLGALIIALGMLIDNAIVVVEGLIIGMEKGRSKWESMVGIVKQTQYPLLAATVIAVIAFAPIGLSPDATGEIVGSLFWVLLISLTISWVVAITITPYFCGIYYKDGEFDHHGDEHADPYGGVIFTSFKWMLDVCMKFPWIFTALLIVMLVVSAKSFKLVKPEFFPPSTINQFQMDVREGFGTDIRTMKERMVELEDFLQSYDEVIQTTSSIGGGHVRFMLSYKPEKHYDNYANLIVTTKNPDDVVPVIKKIREDVPQMFPSLLLTPKLYSVGPQTIGAIELRISGPDPLVLRSLAEEAKAFMRKTPGAESVRDDWLERSKVIRPEFNEINGKRLGISKKELDGAIRANFSGRNVGIYKEGTTIMPVISRPPEDQRVNLDNLQELEVWSIAKQDFVPISQIVDGFEMGFEDAYIMRRDRKRTITVMADYDVTSDITSASVRRLMLPDAAEFEAKLPAGYEMEWGGKFEKSQNAKASVFTTIPGGYLVMFILTVMLFNSFRKGLVIWFVVPLSIIGVVGGLLAFNMPFTFMTLLGALSLTGLMCRNGIVLIDQITIYQEGGAEDYKAIFDGAVSRVRPVALTAIAAILGMIPLLSDAFFAAMAAAMMVGLAIATLLILFAVPVFYMLIYRIKYRTLEEVEAEGPIDL